MGAKIPLNGVRKCDGQTDRQTDTHTYGHFAQRVDALKIGFKYLLTAKRNTNEKSSDKGLNPNGPELLESLKLPGGGGQMAPPSELTNYNPNAKTDVTLYSQL